VKLFNTFEINWNVSKANRMYIQYISVEYKSMENRNSMRLYLSFSIIEAVKLIGKAHYNINDPGKNVSYIII